MPLLNITKLNHFRLVTLKKINAINIIIIVIVIIIVFILITIIGINLSQLFVMDKICILRSFYHYHHPSSGNIFKLKTTTLKIHFVT